MGVGTVHHIAWRTPADESQLKMRKKIVNIGLSATPVIDRRYFHSVYFREPGGILFEIATDPPGFMVDQKEEELGQKLLLPEWLEPERKYLEKVLPKVTTPSIDKFSSYLSNKKTITLKVNTMKQLNFKYRFIPSSLLQGDIENFEKADGPKDRNQLGALTLLLLHGTGGNEDDLIQVGQMISPSASFLSPRGKVLENGMPRFFKRLAEGVFDLEDLKFRTRELADFVKEASLVHSFDLNKTIAVGFSNGANIAASLLLSYPDTLMGAILFRAMVPFMPDHPINLSDKKVILCAGTIDPIVSKSQTQSLFDILERNKADVTLKWQQSGHNLTESDILDVKEWLSEKIL